MILIHPIKFKSLSSEPISFLLHIDQSRFLFRFDSLDTCLFLQISHVFLHYVHFLLKCCQKVLFMLIDYAFDKHARVLDLVIKLHVRVENFSGPSRVLLVYDPYNVKTFFCLFRWIFMVIGHAFTTAEICSVVGGLSLPDTLLKSIFVEILHGTPRPCRRCPIQTATRHQVQIVVILLIIIHILLPFRA